MNRVIIFLLFSARAISQTDLASAITAYAPIILYTASDKTRPANIDWYLDRTSLWCFRPHAQQCLAAGKLASRKCGTVLQQATLIQSGAACGSPGWRSDDLRDKKRKRGFLLRGEFAGLRYGPSDTRLWTTYYAYHRRDSSGYIISYWSFYPFNNGWHGIGDHEGDWEAVEVIIDGDMRPVQLAMLGHRNIDVVTWDSLTFSGTHPLIFADPVGHTSRSRFKGAPARFIQHETWAGGKVRFPDGTVSEGGALEALGNRMAPEQSALRYSGLWGAVHSRLFHNFGYWGPAFNETSERPSGFITAWCFDWTQGPKPECFSPGAR